MSDIYNVKEKMHKMRAKLYPNYLPGYEHTFVARTSNEGAATVADICASMKNRGGYDGDYEDALQTTHHFFMEMMYQLADGFSVNLGFCTIHPNIGGVFHSDKEAHDHKKHPLSFRYRSLKPLRDLRDSIEVLIDGIADTHGYIGEFLDHENNSLNEIYEPGNQFVLTGHKLKIAGEDPSCGMYFVPADHVGAPVKVTRIVENSQNKIIGIIPETTWAYSKIEIRSQFSGSPTVFLKNLRVITSDFTLEHV
jgi:hypothetical protein